MLYFLATSLLFFMRLLNKVDPQLTKTLHDKNVCEGLPSLDIMQALLVNNVPTMSENLRIMKNKLNTYQINNLIKMNSNFKNDTLMTANIGDGLIPRFRKHCPLVPPGLVGPIFDEFTRRNSQPRSASNPEPGGEWAPQACVSNHKVAIIIPFRDRKDNLGVLLSNLHPLLQIQQLHYKIYVVEQFGNSTFNKARLMNIGFTEALKDNVKWECFIFHDVDLIPEDDRNMYSCPKQPRHLSVAVDLFNYTLPYTLLVGGVLAIRTEHFFQVNGYSNIYWGWGGEDDDMGYRIQLSGLYIIRPPANIARYRMIEHKPRTRMEFDVMANILCNVHLGYKTDGLNSLPMLSYDVKLVKKDQLYTHIVVDIGSPPSGL